MIKEHEDSDDPLILYLERRSDDSFDKDEMMNRLRDVLSEYSYKISVCGPFAHMLSFMNAIDKMIKDNDA